MLGIHFGLMIELILYLGLGLVTILLVIFTSYRDKKFNSRLLDIIAIMITITYIIDIIYPIVTGRVNFNRLTFTIGTVLCPFIIITRYIKPFDKIKPTVSLIAIVAIFTYSLYYVRPDSFLNITAQKVFEIYVYYSLVFIYGVLSITTEEVELNVKKCYNELIALSLIELFAFTIRGIISPRARTNTVFWDVLESSPMIVLVSFGFILIIYLINYIIKKIKAEKQ